ILEYQTKKGDKPNKLLLSSFRTRNFTMVEVRAVDAPGVLCLDARNFVKFDIAGDGRLIENFGTSTTASKVQLYNGRAMIGVDLKGRALVSVKSEGLPTAFLNLE